MFVHSLAELSQSLTAGSLLPSSLAALVLRRRELLRRLNMFVTEVPPDLVMTRAEESDTRYREGRSKGPLDGVVVAVKDNFCAEGKTSCASKMLDNFNAPYNSTVVQRLLDMGGVPVGKTNLDEFAMGSGTTDSYAGPTKNVWGSEFDYQLVSPKTGEVTYSHQVTRMTDDWVVAGGSSGGSAVAVAAGVAAAGLGSDTGGSSRIPAAWCGVAGLKPSYGLLSRHGLVPLVNSLDCPSVVTRTVEDCELVLKLLGGRDALDSTSVDFPVAPKEITGVSGLTVGLPREFLCDGMSPEVVSTWSQVADVLDQGGAKVVPVSLPHTELAIPCYSVLNPCEVASNMARYDGLQFGLRGSENAISTEDLYAASRSRGFNEVVRGRILAGNFFLLKENYRKYYLQALKVRRLIQQDYLSLWQHTDLLLTPVTLSDAPAFSSYNKLDNRSQTARQDFCTQPINLAGLPALSIPVTLSERNLPLAVQLVGPANEDHRLLKVGRWLEEQLEFPRLVVDKQIIA